ncbi:MAG: hypothetical protein HY876_04205 [Coriobacteriales bacterium]|nr:hypothetical protein [Coriobacteriales bacterium]
MSHTYRDRIVSAAEWAVVIAILLGIVFAAARPASGRAHEPNAFSSVRIERGDTLWSLAETHPVRGMTTEQVVQLIKRENRIAQAPSAGQVVSVPAAPDGTAVCAR